VRAYLEYAMEKPRNVAKESVVWLLQDYNKIVNISIGSPGCPAADGMEATQVNQPIENDIRRYYISYVMSLIHISPKFTNGKLLLQSSYTLVSLH
jgi:hypothetical protein